jgi:parallel beta-helix repeat protein
VTKTNGIQINAEGVTLDLNGFQISRTTGSGGNGIEIPAISHRATVRNGSMKGFANGILSLFSGGYARACGFRDLSASNCTNAGIVAGSGAVLESCRAHNNSGFYGISADNGSSLTNCTAYGNTASSGIVAGDGCSLTNCTAASNTGSYGIVAGNSSSLTNCSAYSNTGNGAESAGIRANNSTVSSCTAAYNFSTASATSTTGMGFDVGSFSTIHDCTALENRGDGIHMLDFTTARDNSCGRNGTSGNGAGIDAEGSTNRIEGNNVADNDRGIEVRAAGNVIVKNTARGNTTNYSIAAGNIYGAIVDRVIPAGSPTPAPVTGNSAISSAITTDPWANIAY